MRTMWRVGFAVVVVALAAACSGGGGGGGGGSFADRLALLPGSLAETRDDRGVEIVSADLARAGELAGVEAPPADADGQAVARWAQAIAGYTDGATVGAALPAAGNPNRIAEAVAIRDEVGWALPDVAWFTEFANSEARFAVMGGSFDEDAITTAVGEPQDGIWRIGEEDLAIDPRASSAARPIGESLRMALDDDRLIVARDTAPVAEALEDPAITMLDWPGLRPLAEALDAEDAYSAYLLAGGDYSAAGAAERTTPAILEQLQEQILPQPFQAFAAGLADADGEPRAVLVYRHADDAAAAANAEALGRLVAEGVTFREARPWSDLLSVDEIRTDGPTLVARVRLVDLPPAQVYALLFEGESLFLHR